MFHLKKLFSLSLMLACSSLFHIDVKAGFKPQPCTNRKFGQHQGTCAHSASIQLIIAGLIYAGLLDSMIDDKTTAEHYQVALLKAYRTLNQQSDTTPFDIAHYLDVEANTDGEWPKYGPRERHTCSPFQHRILSTEQIPSTLQTTAPSLIWQTLPVITSVINRSSNSFVPEAVLTSPPPYICINGFHYTLVGVTLHHVYQPVNLSLLQGIFRDHQSRLKMPSNWIMYIINRLWFTHVDCLIRTKEGDWFAVDDTTRWKITARNLQGDTVADKNHTTQVLLANYPGAPHYLLYALGGADAARTYRPALTITDTLILQRDTPSPYLKARVGLIASMIADGMCVGLAIAAPLAMTGFKKKGYTLGAAAGILTALTSLVLHTRHLTPFVTKRISYPPSTAEEALKNQSYKNQSWSGPRSPLI